MRAAASSAIILASLTATSAFLAPVPALQKIGSSRRAPAVRTSMMVDGFQDMSSVLLALNKANDVIVTKAGEYPWGSVQAPEWVLPVAAISILSSGVLIPLFLRSGVDAFNAGGPAAAAPGVGPSGKAKTLAAKPAASKAPVKAVAKAPVKAAAPVAAKKPATGGLFGAKAAPAKAAPVAAKPAASAPKTAFPWQKASSSTPAKPAAAKPAPKVAPKAAPKAAAKPVAGKPAAPKAAAPAKKFLW